MSSGLSEAVLSQSLSVLGRDSERMGNLRLWWSVSNMDWLVMGTLASDTEIYVRN